MELQIVSCPGAFFWGVLFGDDLSNLAGGDRLHRQVHLEHLAFHSECVASHSLPVFACLSSNQADLCSTRVRCKTHFALYQSALSSGWRDLIRPLRIAQPEAWKALGKHWKLCLEQRSRPTTGISRIRITTALFVAGAGHIRPTKQTQKKANSQKKESAQAEMSYKSYSYDLGVSLRLGCLIGTRVSWWKSLKSVTLTS